MSQTSLSAPQVREPAHTQQSGGGRRALHGGEPGGGKRDGGGHDEGRRDLAPTPPLLREGRCRGAPSSRRVPRVPHSLNEPS